MSKAGREPGASGETMMRIGFDPAVRRQQLLSRMLELKTLIPQMQEELHSIQGKIQLLDEINPPQRMMGGPGFSAGDDEPPPGAETDSGSNGKPKK